MIFETLIKMFLGLLETIVGFLPFMEFELPANYLNMFTGLLTSVAYFLPMDVFIPLIYLSFILDIVKFTWATLMRIKSFIPFMGD